MSKKIMFSLRIETATILPTKNANTCLVGHEESDIKSIVEATLKVDNMGSTRYQLTVRDNSLYAIGEAYIITGEQPDFLFL